MPRNHQSLSRLILGILTLTTLSACDTGRPEWPRNSTYTLPPGQQTSAVTPPVVQLPSVPPLASGTARPAKVSILLPLSGKGAETGQAMLNAAQLAVFDLGADKFELNPHDTNGAGGAPGAAQAALTDNSQLILGPVFAADAKAVTPLTIPRGVSVISFSTDSSVAGAGGFVMGFLPQSQVSQVLDYATGKGLTHIALATTQDAYGELAANAFSAYMTAHNLQSAGLLRFNPASGATPEQIAAFTHNAGSQPFDAVLIAAPSLPSASLSQQLTLAGFPQARAQRLGTGLWDQPEAARLPALQGAWYAAASPTQRQKFEQRYQQTYNQTAPRLATLAYDATALAIVLSKSGQDYTRPTLTNVNGFAGIDGIFRLRTDGLVERGLAIVELRNNIPTVIREAPARF